MAAVEGETDFTAQSYGPPYEEACWTSKDDHLKVQSVLEAKICALLGSKGFFYLTWITLDCIVPLANPGQSEQCAIAAMRFLYLDVLQANFAALKLFAECVHFPLPTYTAY